MGPSRLEGAELLEICSELSDNPVIHSRNENDAWVVSSTGKKKARRIWQWLISSWKHYPWWDTLNKDWNLRLASAQCRAKFRHVRHTLMDTWSTNFRHRTTPALYIVSHVAPDEKPPMSSLRPAAACQGNISRMQTGSQSSVEDWRWSTPQPTGRGRWRPTARALLSDGDREIYASSVTD